MIKYCPNCGRAAPSDALSCPYCGKSIPSHVKPIKSESLQKKDDKSPIILIIVIVLVVGIVLTIAIAATVYVYVSGMIESPSLETTPEITFTRDPINNSLTVFSCSEADLLWSDIEISGTCDTSELGTYVVVEDTITNCEGIITITHTSSNTLLGVWTFT